MEGSDELRSTAAAASVPATENPYPEVGNKSSKAREEGELSSSADDELPSASGSQLNSASEPQEEAVSLNKSVEGFKAGRRDSSANPKRSIDVQYTSSAQTNSQKSTEKNRAPFVPFVISFSDDDSGSDCEEFRQSSKAIATKGNSRGADGNRRPPASSAPKPQIPRPARRNEARVMPKKVSMSRTFVSSMTKINGVNCWSGGRSLVGQRSRVGNFSTANQKLAGRDHEGTQNMHLNNTELQDLRQQIAIREKELKRKHSQQNKETVSGSSRDYDVVDLGNDAARKRRANSADFEQFGRKEQEKKRLKLSEPHPSQLGPTHTRSVQQQKEDSTWAPLFSGSRSTGGKDGAAIIINGSHCDRNTKLVDPSMSLEQTERIANCVAETSRKKPSCMQLKHSSEPNCHRTRISNKTTCGRNLTAGVQLHDVRSCEKALKPTLSDTHPCAPESNLETSDVSFNDASLCNCLGAVSIPEHKNMEMQTILDIEELQDKELEEAQEHRRKCEIEERNALKAYRNAQRVLIEANARCSNLYRKRELYSAHLRSLMMGNSSLFWSSRLRNGSGAGLVSPDNMSEDNVHQLPTSNHQTQGEFNGYTQQGHHPHIQTADGAFQILPDQHADGQVFASDPCSEPDSSTSEPYKEDMVADGLFSPSSNVNVSADEDEETFPIDHNYVHPGLECQRKGEQYGEGEKDINDEERRKFSLGRSQDSLLLEATLRSQLFAKLGTKTLPKKRGPTHMMEPAVINEVEHGDATWQADKTIGNVQVSAVEKNQPSAFGGTDGLEKSISEPPVQANTVGHAENFSSNYASTTADPADNCFTTEGDQSARSVTFSCPTLRSTFNHLKVAEPISLVGLQSRKKQIHTCDIYNEEGNAAGSTEIQPSISNLNPAEESLMNICAGKVGYYSCNLSIDPFWPLCMFELRGKCNNDECTWQHVKDYSYGKNLENSNNADCQVGIVGSSTHSGKFHCAKNTSKGIDCLDLAPPTYLVSLDMLKANLHPYGCVPTRSAGQCWQKCFSISLVLSCLLPSDSPKDEPFLHGTDARIEVHGSWNSKSLLFHSRNGTMSQLDQHFADSDQTLEMALLNLNQEVDKRKGRIEALKVLARALESNPSCVILWVVYLHIFYSSEKSIGKDDLFHHAVQLNEGSYELWLMYINSRIQLKDRLATYDTALLALCRHASGTDSDTVHASACILDLFLQSVNSLCMSGNVEKAFEKIYELFHSAKNSDKPHPPSLSDILACLTLGDKCIFWLCCVFFIVYKKLPNAIMQQFEREKELFEIEWPSVHLTVDEKQQAVTMIQMAVDSLAICMDSGSLEGESALEAAHMFAVNHIRCIAVLEGLECSKNLLDKYTKLFPSCLELILMSARMCEDEFGDLSFAGFEDALSNWPEEVPGVQCIWNQYAECALENGRFDFVKEIMNRWFHSFWPVLCSRYEVESTDGENSQGSLDLGSLSNSDAWISNSSKIDVLFGLLNLSLHKLLQNDVIEARLAIDRALQVAAAEDYKHCVKEHAMFLLANGYQSMAETPTGGILSILKGYLVDSRAFPASQPLTRKFLQSVVKQRVRQLVGSIWSVVSFDVSLLNVVLEVWHGPSLLPQTCSKLEDLVDLVEAIMEILPSNYQLAMCVCKLLSQCSNPADATSASASFWASSLLVNALFQAVPVAPEYVWVEAADILLNLTDIQSISESFHRRALSVYPFSVNLWKSYLNFSRIYGDANSVLGAARERGIKLQ